MTISQIVCVDSEFGIGRGGSIPWQNKDEMRLFRTMTTGHIVVMGRNTWETLRPISLPGGSEARVLKNRINVVVSTTLNDVPFIKLCPCPEDALSPETYNSRREFSNIKSIIGKPSHGEVDAVDGGGRNIFVIGGGQLYHSTHQLCDTIYLSVLPDSYGCDTHFPQEVLDGFYLEDIVSYDSFKLKIYRKRRC